MVGEAIKLKCPASSPVNKEKRKLLKKRNTRFVLNQPLLMHQSAYGVRSINQHTGYSKFSNEQCEVMANLYIPNIFCFSYLQVIPVIYGVMMATQFLTLNYLF